MNLNREELAAIIDHTLLKPDATEHDIRKLCSDAKRNGLGAVCVNPARVKMARTFLEGCNVAICTVVGFPLGANHSLVKALEAEIAIKDGASEIDMVMNIGALKDGKYADVANDITAVVKVVRSYNQKAVIKVIIETSLLTDREKLKAAEIIRDVGADFVKTSTGFSSGGATVDDIRLLHEAVGEELGIKASGGIRTWREAAALLEAGATRIGTSSGVKILEEFGKI